MISKPEPLPLRLAKRLANYQNPRSFASRLRARRSKPLAGLLAQAHAHRGNSLVRVLDLGGTKRYWNILPPDSLRTNRVHVTLLNLPSEDKCGDHDDEHFTHVYGDACNLSEFEDSAFDIVHSNSVIEHVGSWRNAQSFASEALRVANGVFIQTPYFWFPVEPHYMTPLFHWIPSPLQVALRQRATLGHHRRAASLGEAMARNEGLPRLFDFKTFQFLFPGCQILRERFCLLTKSLIAFRQFAPGQR